MQKLAGAFHEAGHAVVGVKRGGTLKRLTRHETIFSNPHDAATCYAGALAVAKFDNGQGKHSPDDDGDRANVASLNLDPLDRERARATAATLLDTHWEKVCRVARELNSTGELSPERVAELVS
jgi:hypothetical protein